ncbi:hypothetical protein [Bartonella sp. MU37NMGALS]|uniref:hypothetical protein n=1 Tax=Bartonella sp. MU37NMGALS TaxID=3243560 RepID=UPI0035D128DF
MPNNDTTQNANNQKTCISLPPLIVTSCYENFSDTIPWFNFQNTTPFDIKVHSVSAIYHQDPHAGNKWERSDLWSKAFLSIGMFNPPFPIHIPKIENEIYFISPPEKPESEVLLKNITIPAHKKHLAIMGIQFWADIDRTCIASTKITFQFSPTYDFTKIFNVDVFLEGMFLFSPKEEAEGIQSAWDEIENMTEELKSYQLRGILSNM